MNAEEKLAQIASILEGIAPAPPHEDAAPWHRPTLAQARTFAGKVGLTVEQVLGWDRTGANVAQTKAPPVGLGDVAAAKEYAAFGYRPDGTHYLWTQDWISGQRDFADRILSCASASEAAVLLPGCESADTDAVVYGIMTGLVSAPKFTPFQAPVWRYGLTVADLVGYLQNVAPADGPGPGIG